jgi:hypothetical protein
MENKYIILIESKNMLKIIWIQVNVRQYNKR